MSAYKKLNRQDVFISDYVARKQWNVAGNVLADYGISRLKGISSSLDPYEYLIPNETTRNQVLLYNSVRHLYYPKLPEKYDSPSGSRDLSYESNTVFTPERELGSTILVVSIPRQVYGDGIQPGTFDLKLDSLNWITDNKDGKLHLTSAVEYTTPEIEYLDTPFSNYVENTETPGTVVGDIIYSQGQVIITDPIIASQYFTGSFESINWKSTLPIYTQNVHCKFSPYEMNYSYNPSAITGSDAIMHSNITGSSFSPYITTVGLYNDANELLAVAKPNRPIPKSLDADMVFVVQIDI